jgi:hypothetical protein
MERRTPIRPDGGFDAVRADAVIGVPPFPIFCFAKSPRKSYIVSTND